MHRTEHTHMHILHIGHCRQDIPQHRERFSYREPLTHLHTHTPTESVCNSCDRKCQFIRGNSRFFISSFHMLNLPLFFCSSSSFLFRYSLVKAQSWRKKIYSNHIESRDFVMQIYGNQLVSIECRTYGTFIRPFRINAMCDWYWIVELSGE